jgi:hypothetical protein
VKLKSGLAKRVSRTSSNGGWQINPANAGAKQAEVGDLADGTPAVFRRQDTRVPLGVIPDMVTFEEDLLLEARREARKPPDDPVEAIAQAGHQGGIK